MWEDADAWKAERRPTAHPAPRLISREWLELPNPNMMYNHPEVAIKNWALRWTDGGHSHRQNRRMTTLNRPLASLALSVAARARAEDRLANRN